VKTKTADVSLSVSEEDQVKYHLPEALPSQVEFEEYTLYLSEFGHDGSEQHTVLEKLRRAEEGSELVIRIDSPGGYVTEGIKLYNISKECFKGRTTTTLDAMAYSMGALMFCAGDKRVVYEESSLMFHDFSGGEFGKGGEMKDSLEHSLKFIHKFFKKITVKKGFLSNEEFRRMTDDSKQWWFDASEMCYRGIATHVIVDGHELTAEQFVDYDEGDLDIEEWIEANTEFDDGEMSEEDVAAILSALGLKIDDSEEEEDASTD
jgi:ATP-dependent protease ClpP protease subunit